MIRINFGLDNSVEVAATKYPTVGDLKRDESLKAFLGFGDNVEIVINGVAVGDDYALDACENVCIRTRANKKG